MQHYLDSKPHYAILDGLRGVAAVVILLYHLCEGCGLVLGHGYLAVDFFYALSGFVVGYAYDDRRKALSVGVFAKRRIIRLHPMAVMGTLIGLGLYYFSQSAAFPLVGQSPWWVVLLLCGYCCLMLPMPNTWDIRGWQDFNSFNGNSWSLYWEYFANLLYVFILRWLPTAVLGLLTLVAAVGTLDLTLNFDLTGLLTGGRVGAPYTVNGGWSLTPSELYIGLIRLLYPFLSGLLLARLGRFIRLRGAFGWCSLLVVANLLTPQLTGLANGWFEAFSILLLMPFIIALGAGSSLSGKWWERTCNFLGEISYPLYITHLPFIYLLIGWRTNHPEAPVSTLVFLSVLLFFLSLATAYATLRLYDVPVRTWLRKHWGR